MVASLSSLKEVTASIGLRDQILVTGRMNSTLREGSDEVQFGVGRKVYPYAYRSIRGQQLPLIIIINEREQ